MSQFNKFLETSIAHKNEIQVLPLNHIANILHLENIIENTVIDKEYIGKCEVFEEYLLYFFYGKPSFKLNDENALPVCFAIEKNQLETYKVFPFDSGAYYHNRMSDFFTTSYSLDDFLIPNNLECISNLVRKFYVSNRNYVENLVNFNFENSTIPNIIAEYLNLIKSKANEFLDERKQTIEVIYNKNILLKDCTKFIIIPKTDFIMNDSIVNYNDYKNYISTKINCEVLSYNIIDSTDSYEQIKSIFKSKLDI